MADRLSPEQRSRNMSAIRSRNTSPEMAVRKLVHGLGYRFRLHRKDLPGTPDLVFPSRRAVVFVHGCYWHGHGCPRGGAGSKTNQSYWGPKIARNRDRDEVATARLIESGWRVLTVWECEVGSPAVLSERLIGFLNEGAAASRPPHKPS